VSQGGAIWPGWSRDGRELYFLSAPPLGQMVAVAVKPPKNGAFDFAPPVRLFPMSAFYRSTNRGYDTARDGRFLVVGTPQATRTERASIHFITNWFDDLRARVK
jgi:hypothetical protein